MVTDVSNIRYNLLMHMTEEDSSCTHACTFGRTHTETLTHSTVCPPGCTTSRFLVWLLMVQTHDRCVEFPSYKTTHSAIQTLDYAISHGLAPTTWISILRPGRTDTTKQLGNEGTAA